SSRRCLVRLCRPDLRKASGFPARAGGVLLLRAGWKAQPSSPLGGGQPGNGPSERQSLSASQAAEPQVVVGRIERTLDRPEVNSPLHLEVEAALRRQLASCHT